LLDESGPMPVLRYVGKPKRDPAGDRCGGHVCVEEADLPGVRAPQADECLHELELAISVYAGDTDDLTAPDGEAHFVHAQCAAGIAAAQVGDHQDISVARGPFAE
jgi:hypothetical protein